MRTCSACGKADRPVLEPDLPCNPKLCPPTADWRTETHHDQCPRVLHEVRLLYKPAKLVHTPRHPEGTLETRWLREGWTLLRDGGQMFRSRMLCRECIEREAEREMLRRDYLKACRKARGIDDRTYGDLMLEQTG